MFERSEFAKRKRDIEKKISMPELGEVVEIQEHTEKGEGSADDFSNFEADVILQNNEELRNIPISTSIPGSVIVPRSAEKNDGDGDLVIIQYIEGDGEYPIVTDVLYNTVDRAPLARDGMYRMKRGRLYEDIHPDGEYFRYSYKEDDDFQEEVAFGLYDDDPEDDDIVPQVRYQQNMAQYPAMGGEMKWSGYTEEATDEPYALGRFRLHEDEMFIVNSMSLSDEEGIVPVDDAFVYLFDIDQEEELWSFWEQEPGEDAEDGWPVSDDDIPINVDIRYESSRFVDRRVGEPLYVFRWDDEFEGESSPKNLEVHVANEGAVEKLSFSMTCAIGKYDPDIDRDDFPEDDEEYIL